MPRSKTSAFLSVLLVFASGLAMGAVGYRLYAVRSVASGGGAGAIPAAPPHKSPDEFRKALVNSMKEKVNLDDAQVAAVQKIYQDQHEGFDKVNKNYQELIDKAHGESARERDRIHDAAVAKIKALLRPDQVPLYTQWQADLAAKREADRKKQKQQRDHDRHPDGRQFPPPPRP